MLSVLWEEEAAPGPESSLIFGVCAPHPAVKAKSIATMVIAISLLRLFKHITPNGQVHSDHLSFVQDTYILSHSSPIVNMNASYEDNCFAFEAPRSWESSWLTLMWISLKYFFNFVDIVERQILWIFRVDPERQKAWKNPFFGKRIADFYWQEIHGFVL